MNGSREEWVEARAALLEREKELTRLSDELASQRRELPWVRVEREYVFDTVDGQRTLAELFDGRAQLLVYHFMHGPRTPKGCTGCTYATDGFDGAVPHLAHHDVTFLCAARSPLDVLEAYRRRMGWQIPFVSSGETTFNDDFAPLGLAQDEVGNNEWMAFSAFAFEDGAVYHTYTANNRGTDALNPTWQLLDRAPLGRDGGRIIRGWARRHDEYPEAVAH